jgi:regulation of enolase protein 1 (concanavalin A-like superfamily)
MKRNFLFTIGASLLLLGLVRPQAHAYTHPCIPTTREELDTIKASLNQEPWKSGYALLAADGHSSLNYTMQGPFVNVSRAGSYDANLGPWQQDMTAVYNLARMWYFTGNAAYAQKAHDILIAWANTNTSFTGNESGLALGDYAASYGGGASILRGTWSGWTAADTTAVQNYFSNVLWPASLGGGNVLGPANKGAIYMESAIAIAAFCDDTAKFNQVINLYRTFHGSGLMNTLATGQMGETGRDAGHAYGTLNALAFVAEVAWKQGVDLYSELDNRLLACGEYYVRNTFTTDNPYVPYGTIDWAWFNNAAGPYTANRSAFYILQNAYKNRKNLPTPWIDRKLQEQNVDAYNFMFAKTADFTTATVTPASFPAVSPASSGLTLTTLGSQTTGRSVSYSNGVWTMTGLGNSVWSDTTDDCQFAYTTMTGDCAMVAKVNSFTYSGNNNGKAGLMIRDNLTATISQRAWIGVVPAATVLMESHMRGWTENWGGGGYDDRSHSWTPGLPYWIKIERRGKQITTFASPDGTSWMPLNCTYYGNLPSTLYLGLFLCSGTTTAQTATFSNVAFTGGTGGLVTTPAAPAGLLASGSNKAITVRWLPSFGATSYDLLRSTTSGSGYTALASNLSTTSYVDTTAVAGTTYYYVARAKNSAGTSGNSSQFGATLLPTAMVNLAFSGTSTASFNQNSATEGSAKAFDGNPGSKWFCYNSPTGWIQYDFGAGNAQVVKRYTINCADVATRDPISWNLRGSQDGSSWTWLASASNQTFAIRMGMNTYDIGNTTAYRFYRLEITANNGDTGMAIAEFGLWGDSGQTIPDGTYRIVSRKSNKVLDLVNGSTADGTDAIQWGWNGGNDQKWTLTYLGNGQYKAVGVASSKLLEVTNASTSDGAGVQIWPSNNNNCQKWTIAPSGDGSFKVLNVNSGKAMDVASGSTADGAGIIQWPYNGGDNQQWRFSLSQ